MRLKQGKEQSSDYKCCFSCCHVRTGTLALGLFHLVCNVVVLCGLAALMLNPGLEGKLSPTSEPQLQDDLFNDDFSFFSVDNNTYNYHHKSPRGQRCVGFAITLFAALLAFMLVCGTVKGRPAYLLPHLILQVFDFCITCLSGIGFFTYAPDVKAWITAHPDFPYKKEVLELDEQWLILISMSCLVTSLLFKAYFIGVVYNCYQWLTRYAGQMVVTRDPEYSAHGDDDDEVMLLPPKYEEVMMSGPRSVPPTFPYLPTA